MNIDMLRIAFSLLAILSLQAIDCAHLFTQYFRVASLILFRLPAQGW